MPEFHGKFEYLGDTKLKWGTDHLGTVERFEHLSSLLI